MKHIAIIITIILRIIYCFKNILIALVNILV